MPAAGDRGRRSGRRGLRRRRGTGARGLKNLHLSQALAALEHDHVTERTSAGWRVRCGFSVADLASPDGIARDQAIALLVSYGPRATAALLPLLDGADVELRARAARALAYSADPATADRLAAPSPETRARARLVILQIAAGWPPDEAAAWRARATAADAPGSASS